MGKGMWHEGMCQGRGPGGSLARWEQSSVIEVVGLKLERQAGPTPQGAL